MKRHIVKAMAAMLCGALLLSGSSALAAGSSEEMDAAAAYLNELGIMKGDLNGNLYLESNLNRTELATVLARLSVKEEHLQAERKLYESQCIFTDVPDWAKVYIGYCVFNHYMLGYGGDKFGGGDLVSPSAASTVVLRWLGYSDTPAPAHPERQFDYHTADTFALNLGLTTVDVAGGDDITRGELAVMLYRAMGNMEYANQDGKLPISGGLTKNTDGSINLPSDGSRYEPHVGDVIRCDDGSNYTLTDISRWDNNLFSLGPVGPLPEPTCDWSSFPEVKLPAPEARRFQNEQGDYLFIRNLYETRRMQYTIMNLAGDHPETSENGKLKYSVKGTPLVRIELTIPAEKEFGFFWPWRESELERNFMSCPPGRYCLEAWDVYKNGIFLRTEYDVYAL